MMAKRLMRKPSMHVKRRALSILMALVLIMGLLPTSVFAQDDAAKREQAEMQIIDEGGTVYYDTQGNQVEKDADDVVVEMSKTVAATGVENEFEVTLQVKTTQKLTEIPASTPDAAVMLVLDVSNSMDYCMECGKNVGSHGHNFVDRRGGGWFGWDPDGYCDQCGIAQESHWYNGVCSEQNPQSRLEAAQEAALDFLNQFANETGATGDDRRMVAIVSFGSNAEQELDWVDVRTEAGMTAAVAKVNGVQVGHGHGVTSDYGGTNIEGGLMLAKNILNAGRQNENQIRDVNYLYTILLTDGNPTYYVQNSSSSTTWISGTQGGGSKTNESDAKDVGNEAQAIRSMTNLSKLYSICFGTVTEGSKTVDVWDTKPFGNWRNANPRTTSNMTVGDWLAAFSSDAYNGQATGLFDSFDSIAAQIATAAQAWRVTDTMGENIVYESLVPVYNKKGTGTINNVITLGDDGNSFVWNILSSEFDDNITDIQLDQNGQMISGTLGYTFKYRIRLDNSNFAANVEKATNAAATLKYMVANADGSWPENPEDLKTGTFAVPVVKGYVGGFSFDKVAYHNGELGLSGAKFTLAHSADCDCGQTIADRTSANTGSSYSFSGIPSGHTYTMTETKAPSSDYVASTAGTYTVEVAYGVTTVKNSAGEVVFDSSRSTNSMVVTNQLDPKYGVTVTKIWQDSAYTAGRPDSVSITLTGSNGKSYNKTISGDKNNTSWKTSFNDIPTVDVETGEAITYALTETQVSGYKAPTYGTNNEGYTVTNALDGTRDITVTKTWLAPESLYADASVQITLYADGNPTSHSVTLPQNGSWTYTFEDVERYLNGAAVNYTIVETVTGVDASLFESPLYTGSGDNLGVTNAVKQDYENINGAKNWVDGGNATGTRPDPTTVEVTATGSVAGYTYTTKLTENSTYSFTNLPKYDIVKHVDQATAAVSYTGTGAAITYTVTDSVGGYTNTTAGTAGNNYQLTNTVDSGNISITLAKAWDDNDNADGTRPDSVTLELWRSSNGGTAAKVEGAEATFAAAPVYDPEDETTVIGYSWDNVSLTSSAFSVPARDEQGYLYIYEVREAGAANGSISGQNGATYAITTSGTVSNQNGALTLTNTLNGGETSVTVNKVWKDPYIDDTRTANTTITLYADGEPTSYTVTLPYTDSENVVRNSYTFTVPKYDGGDVIQYTAVESAVTGYNNDVAAVATGSMESGFTFTNTITQDSTHSVTVTKAWEGGPDAGANRPGITITLKRTGDNSFQRSITGAELDANGQYTFTNLDKYDLTTGAEWNYYVEETMDANHANAARYTTEVNGFTITNTFNAGTTSVSGDKHWVVPAGTTLPESITVNLYQDKGTEPYRTATVTAESDTESTGVWHYSFTDLPQYSETDGHQFTYTVEEDDVAGYTSTLGSDGTTIYNTHKEYETQIPVTATKTWVGPADLRPDSIQLQLYRSVSGGAGVAVGEPVTVTKPAEDNGQWTYSFGSQPKYNAAQQQYTYYVEEVGDNISTDSEGAKILTCTVGEETAVYSVEEDGMSVANTIRQDTIDIKGEKIWNNNGRPVDGITVELYASNQTELVDSVELPRYYGADGELNTSAPQPGDTESWSYEFLDLPKYNLGQDGDGSRILYSVKEQGEAAGVVINKGAYYEVTYPNATNVDSEGFDITNTYKDTNEYGYQVNVVYTYTYNGGTPVVSTVTGTVENGRVVKGANELTFNLATADYAQYDGKTYSYDKGTLAVAGVLQEDVALANGDAVTTEQVNTTYVITLYYTLNETGGGGGSTYYTVTVNYYDQDTGDKIAQSYTKSVRSGNTYDVTEYDAIAIEGYTYVETTGDPLTGRMNSNKVINVYYTVEEINVDDPNVPQGELPDDPGTDDPGTDDPGTDDPGTNIDDPNVPQGELPDDPGTNIDDPNVPLTDVPNTGDSLMAWVAAAAVSGIGLIWVALSGKKRKDETV